MTKKLYVYTNKYQKRLMQDMMDRMNEITYCRLQLELALYGYVNINEFAKKYPTDSFSEENDETR
ncbi:hypothetical protein LCGC14_1985260 [marine sediment metagenome]|uniref:Uncharacterized protein n=1 Tax=marine sediment metagenome TaxID=412755 RepID=A0A0F9F7L8_9ZZZZ